MGKYKGRLTLHCGDDFLGKIKEAATAAGQSVNEYAMTRLQKFLSGEVLATGEILQGESGKHCIQPLDKNYKPEQCPFRIEYPQLQKTENGLTLQEKFCGKCPHYKKDFEAFKVLLRIGLRNPNLFPTTVKPEPPKFPEFVIHCTEKKEDGSPCEHEWHSLYFEEYDDWMWEMRRRIQGHYSQLHGKGYLPAGTDPLLIAKGQGVKVD